MTTNSLLVIAYIDPGSGSFILQMLIAGLVGCLAFFRKFWLGLFRRRKDEKTVTAGTVPPAQGGKSEEPPSSKPASSRDGDPS